MSSSEQMIDIDAASAGMVLAADLKDASGVVLLPAGATLSESSLNSLRRRGIEQIGVLQDAAPEDAAALQAERVRQCARLQRLFRRSAEVGASAKLLERLTSYRKGELA
jgi:hypothetical protein